MVVKRTKIFVILLVLFISLFTSCTVDKTNNNEKKEYSITYIYDNKVVEHNPKTYISGVGINLTDYDVEGFIGWYTNPEFSGNEIKKIDENHTGDITLFAKVESKTQTTYNITYIYNGNTINLEPSTYKEGEEVELPTPSINGFIGWYTNQEFIGESIEIINKNNSGDITLFAKIEEKIEPGNDLELAFNNMTNYSYVFGYVSEDGEDVYVSNNAYYNGNFKQNGYDYYGDYFEEYVVTKDNMLYIYTLDYDGESYVAIAEDDPFFDSYYSYFDIVLFDGIDANLFEYKNGYFALKDNSKIDEIASLLLGDYEDDIYTSLQIKVENNVITEILATSLYTYEGYTYNYDYEVTFSNHGNTVFELPNVNTSMATTQPISDVQTANDDTTVITKGYVNGIVGNNVYIEDNTGGIYLYFASNASFVNQLTYGQEIVVEGIKDTYKGLPQITNISSVEITGNTSPLYHNTLASVDEETIALYLCQVVDFNNIYVHSVNHTNDRTNKDVTYIVGDGINEIPLFISKYLDSNLREELFNILDNNLKINIENIIIGYFNNYQLTVTSNTLFNIVNTDGGNEDIKFVTPNKAPDDTKKLSDVLPDFGVVDGVTYGLNKGLPSTGNPQVLVIPIAFSDYPAPSSIQDDLEIAFFGTSEETGWESLTSYYYKASYGKLNIEGTVLPAFNTGKKSTYYDEQEDGDYLFIKEALEYYDATVNYSDYDYDKDGYIDSIYFIYTCPYSYDDASMYWAYTYEYYTDDYEYYDNVEADFYVLASYDFLFDELASGKTITYNTETIIHETGHLLGLDDYYDYDENAGPHGGIGGGDMMDYNIGDHNPFTKILLGWTTPYIVENDSVRITLNSFGQSGDVLLIPKKFNGSYLSEYYLIDLYTPDGLNALEKGYNGLFNTSGIRVFHVDATLKDTKDANGVWEIYQYNNSDTNHKLLKLIEADGNNKIENLNYGLSENSDLFKSGSTYTNSKWYDGTSTNFTMKVVSLDNNSATIEVILK